MSRKNSPKKARLLSAPNDGDPVLRAQDALTAGRFREAIESYKALLKRERRAEWLQALAQAYAGRAEQLTAKGMHKEALALWHARAQACGAPLVDEPYVRWLVQTNQPASLLALLGSGTSLTPELTAQLHRGLAAYALHADDAALAPIPGDAPLRRHLPAARAAWAAAVARDEAALAQNLQAIPHRSPYRDLRLLLKALNCLACNKVQAAELLARVPDTGPFAGLTAALRVAALPEHAWLAGLRALDEAGRTLALELAGCPQQQHALVKALADLDERSAPPALLDLVLRHRHDFPSGTAYALSLRALAHAASHARRFDAAFATQSTRADARHAAALSAELALDLDRAREHWLRLVQELRRDPAQHRRAAMILRHLATERGYLDTFDNVDTLEPWDVPGIEDEDDPTLICLLLSQELDPGDADSEARVLRQLRQQGDLKRVRGRAAVALARFPRHAPVLLEAVEAALAGGAFKKAVGLAKQLLQIDPINPQVRAAIGAAHLAHARKRLAAGDRQAVLRELDAADEWVRTPSAIIALACLRALATEPAEAGDAVLHRMLTQQGQTLTTLFQLALQAERNHVGARTMLQRAGADLDMTPSLEQLLALASSLNAEPANDRALKAAFTSLQPMLDRAIDAAQGRENELMQLCEAFLRVDQSASCRRVAERALQRWADNPAFVYFDVAAAHGHSPSAAPHRQLQRLEKAYERADAQGDQRSANRIARLLDAAQPRIGSLGGPFDGDGAPLAVPSLADAIGGASMLKMLREQLGAEYFDELRQRCNGNVELMLETLLENNGPDPMPTAPRRPAAGAPSKQKGLFDE